MKKLLLIVALVVVVAVGASLASVHYKNYQNKKQAQAATATAQQVQSAVAQAKDRDSANYQSLVVEYNSAVAQCQKGNQAYAKLTPTQQRQTAAPVCPAVKS